MASAHEIVVWLSILWAAASLVVQVLAVRAGRRRDYSRRAGDPLKAVIYNFTTAMVPTRKESARRHPMEFLIGMVLHAGAILAVVSIPVWLARPEAGFAMISACRPLFAASLVAGVILFARRTFSKNLRAMSAPDDYVAILLTCGLLAVALYPGLPPGGPVLLLTYAIVFFAYLPLGKLRHMVFFFAARADYGFRLGYRGVYPPARMITEHPDARR